MKYGYVYMKVWIYRLPIRYKEDGGGKGEGVVTAKSPKTFRKGIRFLVCLGYMRAPRIMQILKIPFIKIHS